LRNADCGIWISQLSFAVNSYSAFQNFMSDTMISVENVGKLYTLKHKNSGVRYSTLRDVISRGVAAPFGAFSRMRRSHGRINNALPQVAGRALSGDSVENFWAIKDISFKVQQGDVVGIIGRNGAGKSTILKILSRITEPTVGRIRIKGRVASLLEVGTGFHAELTGRENIFLNGAILGMSRVEIKAKFDEIVAFAAVEQFLDTPVKRYSSGMYVRLAFAVAAHLEPQILIVDEVLAVGDAEFQKKCLGKMREVATGGRTILFVSHNMQAVSVLCNRGMFFRAGSLEYTGSAKEAIDRYTSSFSKANGSDDPDRRYGSGEYRYTFASPARQIFGGAEEKVINFEIERRGKPVGRMWACALIFNSDGAIVAQCDSRLVGFLVEDTPRMSGSVRFTTPWLKPGSYRVDLSVGAPWTIDYWETACSLVISPALPYPHSAAPDATAHGLVFADFSWQASEAQQEFVCSSIQERENDTIPDQGHCALKV
jgi:lipopolysaccharide transport system ATP-binding protein